MNNFLNFEIIRALQRGLLVHHQPIPNARGTRSSLSSLCYSHGLSRPSHYGFPLLPHWVSHSPGQAAFLQGRQVVRRQAAGWPGLMPPSQISTLIIDTTAAAFSDSPAAQPKCTHQNMCIPTWEDSGLPLDRFVIQSNTIWGASVVAQQVKLLPGTPELHMRVQIWFPSCFALIQLPAKVPGKAMEDSSGTCSLVPRWKSWFSSWHGLSLAPAVWPFGEWTSRRKIPLSSPVTASQISK